MQIKRNFKYKNRHVSRKLINVETDLKKWIHIMWLYI